jgi:hypothetical protein
VVEYLHSKSEYLNSNQMLVPPKQTNKQKNQAGHRWLMPIIPATQEAEIKRIMVQSQSGQTVPRDPISKKPITKKSWWSGCKKKKPTKQTS